MMPCALAVVLVAVAGAHAPSRARRDPSHEARRRPPSMAVKTAWQPRRWTVLRRPPSARRATASEEEEEEEEGKGAYLLEAPKKVDWRGVAILGALVLQTAGGSLLARSAYMQCRYDGGTASLLQEVLKVPLAVGALVGMGQSMPQVRAMLGASVRPSDLAPLAVPSACFAAQNVLFFVAHERLPSTVYLVLSQSKTLWTALFSVALLPGKRLSRRQWVAQPLLALGCALVLMQQLGGDFNGKRSATAVLVGAAACISSAIFSGFANVYFERIVKKDGDDFWARQLQLALVTSLFTLPALPRPLGAMADCISALTPAVWGVVLIKAVGGLLIGATIKYTSSIYKNFATALAIILTAAFNPGAFQSPSFVSGIALVFASMGLFQSKGRHLTASPTPSSFKAPSDSG